MNDKELLKLIKSRRSIRNFKDIPVKEEDLRDLVEAGIFAPSGANTQNQRFVVTTKQEDIDFFGKNRHYLIKSCKAIISVWSDWSACWNNYPKKSKFFPNLPYWDCGASIQNILILAESKGLSTCWVSMHPKMPCMKKVNKKFSIPKDYEIMGLVVIGYANEKINYEKDIHPGSKLRRRPIKRKPIDFYIHKWRNNAV